MKKHTSGFKDEIKTLGKQQSVRITYTLNDEQIILTNEDINSATPNYEASLLKSVMKALELDSNVSIPKGTEIKFEYGLLVNEAYEYLDYGNYIVAKEPEKQEDTLSYKITCYDKMLYSMKDYEHIDITYPCTIKQYLIALCNKIGLQFKDSDFANASRQIRNELFMTINEDGTYSSMGYTYRDVLDQIAETTGGCICMTLDDKVEVRYINELYNKKSVTGNPIYITDSIESELTINKIEGSHSQKTTQGINLCDLNVTQNNRVTYNSDGTITINGTGGFTLAFKRFTAKANTKYYIKWELVSGTVDTSKSNGNSFLNPLDATNIKQGEFKESIVENDKDISGFWVNNMAVFTNAVIKIWFSETQSDFEPYTGGKPSPSPDYPQEIETVGDNVNIIDVNNFTQALLNVNDGTLILNQSWRCTDYLDVLYKEYNFSWESDSPLFQVKVCFYDKGKNFLSSLNYLESGIYSKSFKVPNGSRFMRLSYSINVNSVAVARKKIKLEKGTKATPYSPYGQGSVEVKIVNKNFVKIDETIDFSISTVQFTYKDGKLNLNGTSNANISSVNNNFKNYFKFVLPAGSYTYSQKNSVNSDIFTYIRDLEDTSKLYVAANGNSVKKVSFTLEKTTEVFIGMYSGSNVTFNNVEIELQIEKGLTATDFVEHQEQAITMPIQQEMLEGDYIDSTEHHEWKKLVLDGTTKKFSQYSKTPSKNNALGVYSSDIKQPLNYQTKAEIYCNILGTETTDYLYNNANAPQGIAVSVSQKQIWMYFGKDTELTSLATGNEYLKEMYDKGNPVIIYYKLATPIELELTDEQKAVKNTLINAYEPITKVYASDILAKLDITYANSKEIIDEEYINDTNVNFGEKYRTD